MLLTGENFSSKNTPKLARELIGKIIKRKINGKVIEAVISETEAYHGFSDKASHASRGKTPRNKPMFGKAGSWYVYFIYGNHFMLNLITGPENYPSAILLRGILVGDKKINGPGRLTKFLNVDKQFNDQLANKKTGLWIEDRGVKINPHTKQINFFGMGVKQSQIEKLPRVGIDYAEEKYKNKLWRFRLK